MERYNHLNAEFQRIARRDNKAFLSDQCKEIEENNTMGMIRDLFKKIREFSMDACPRSRCHLQGQEEARPFLQQQG